MEIGTENMLSTQATLPFGRLFNLTSETPIKKIISYHTQCGNCIFQDSHQ